jgi:hypothetical protein
VLAAEGTGSGGEAIVRALVPPGGLLLVRGAGGPGSLMLLHCSRSPAVFCRVLAELLFVLWGPHPCRGSQRGGPIAPGTSCCVARSPCYLLPNPSCLQHAMCAPVYPPQRAPSLATLSTLTGPAPWPTPRCSSWTSGARCGGWGVGWTAAR